MFNLFKRSPKPTAPAYVTIVSGLPRSGTSMMMKMLEAGGIPLITDNQRTADEDNPKGYFELEQVKQLKEGDIAWVRDAQGKAVKVISALLEHLPPTSQYRVIFMRRAMEEILASQRQMLIRRGEPTDAVADEQMAEMFSKHLAQIEIWLSAQPNMKTLYLHYQQVAQAPAVPIARLAQFLDRPLDQAAMQTVVDGRLYRQRKP